MFVIYFVSVLEEGFNQTLMMIDDILKFQNDNFNSHVHVPETKYKTSLYPNFQKFPFSRRFFVVSAGVYQSHS